MTDAIFLVRAEQLGRMSCAKVLLPWAHRTSNILNRINLQTIGNWVYPGSLEEFGSIDSSRIH